MTIDYTRPPQPQQPMGQPPRGWWSRNWKWFVPLGCLGLIALCAIFIAGIIGVVFGAMKSSDVYRGALQRAKNSPEVQAALGTPIEEGWFMSGHINMQNNTGDADINIPISGPKGKGTIHAVAKKEASSWKYSVLEVQVHGGPTISLLRETSTLGSIGRVPPES
jgi:cytochrome oxidase complex assembly protein 1